MGMGKLGLECQIVEEAEMLMEHLGAERLVNPANFTSNNNKVFGNATLNHKDASSVAGGFRCSVPTPTTTTNASWQISTNELTSSSSIVSCA